MTEGEEEEDVDEQHKGDQKKNTTEGVVLTFLDYQLLGLDQLEHGFEV